MTRSMRCFPPAVVLFCTVTVGAQSAPADHRQAQGSPVDSPTTYTSPEMRTGTQYFSLEHRAPEQVIDEDARVLEQRKGEIAREAGFYLFNLDAGNWTYEQVICPEIPGQLLLEYSSNEADGKVSRFGALVPRQAGRVRVVPVLYRGTVPFGEAVSSPRNIRIFNAAVPADIAKESAGENGHWLSLVACYVELTSGHSHIPSGAGFSAELAQVPEPTLMIRPAYSQVVFADRGRDEKIVVWSVTFNREGRLMTAGMDKRSLARVNTPPAEHPVETRPGQDATPLKTVSVPDSTPLKSKVVPKATMPVESEPGPQKR